MLEGKCRRGYQQIFITPLLQKSFIQKLTPNFITVLACFFGIATLPLLVFDLPWVALAFLLGSGFLDTLDGSLARHLKITSHKGSALDIVSDRIVEFSVVLGLCLIDPSQRALPSFLMVGSMFLCITTFLVVGILTVNDSEKGFHYSPGIMERAESLIIFSLMIIFPSAFVFLAYLFTFLVFLTAFVRMKQFWKLHS